MRMHNRLEWYARLLAYYSIENGIIYLCICAFGVCLYVCMLADNRRGRSGGELLAARCSWHLFCILLAQLCAWELVLNYARTESAPDMQHIHIQCKRKVLCTLFRSTRDHD